MVYKLDMNIKSSPFFPWHFIFMSLSIKQFSLVYDKLDFPFYPPEDLRQVAHDFALTDQMQLRGPDYEVSRETIRSETTVYDLLAGTAPEDPYEKRRDALFTNTFAQLERMSYAEAVYRWATQTHTYCKYANKDHYFDLEALDDWFRFLRQWAVLEWLEQPISAENRQDSSGWTVLFDKFVPIYTRKPTPGFPEWTLEALPIVGISRTKLQTTILDHESQKLYVETTMDEVFGSPKTAWEDYAMRPGIACTWIKLEGRMRINFKAWKTLLKILSSDERQLLGQWVLQHQEQRRSTRSTTAPSIFEQLANNRRIPAENSQPDSSLEEIRRWRTNATRS